MPNRYHYILCRTRPSLMLTLSPIHTPVSTNIVLVSNRMVENALELINFLHDRFKLDSYWIKIVFRIITVGFPATEMSCSFYSRIVYVVAVAQPCTNNSRTTVLYYQLNGKRKRYFINRILTRKWLQGSGVISFYYQGNSIYWYE